MMNTLGNNPPSDSLFDKPDANRLKSNANHQQLKSVVQKFEGMLWNQVAQSMNRVKMGPDNLGPGGQMYQRMMWRRVSETAFSDASTQLTQATMKQLLPHANTDAIDKTGLKPASRSIDVPKSSDTTAEPEDNDSWVQSIWSAVKAGAETLNVPVKAVLAQAALETGWGDSVKGNNLFGIKSHGDGNDFTTMTHEFEDGVMRQVRAAFQGYRDVSDAVSDFVDTLRRMHPDAVGQQTIAGYARSLQDSGYATDPRYASKIEAVANSSHMQEMLRGIN